MDGFTLRYSPILFFGVRVRSLLRFLGLNYRNNSVLLMILTTQPKVLFGFPLRSLLLPSSIFLVRVLRFLGLYYRKNSYRLKCLSPLTNTLTGAYQRFNCAAMKNILKTVPDEIMSYLHSSNYLNILLR